MCWIGEGGEREHPRGLHGLAKRFPVQRKRTLVGRQCSWRDVVRERFVTTGQGTSWQVTARHGRSPHVAARRCTSRRIASPSIDSRRSPRGTRLTSVPERLFPGRGYFSRRQRIDQLPTTDGRGGDLTCNGLRTTTPHSFRELPNNLQTEPFPFPANSPCQAGVEYCSGSSCRCCPRRCGRNCCPP